MKKTARNVAIAALALFASCQQVAEDTSESRSMVTLKVRATTIEQDIATKTIKSIK